MSASALRFLADESCDFAVVRALRAEGYDVLAVSEVMRRSDDRELIDQAGRERRILLTDVISQTRRRASHITLIVVSMLPQHSPLHSTESPLEPRQFGKLARYPDWARRKEATMKSANCSIVF